MKTTTIPVLQDLPAHDRILLAAHKLFYRDGIRATGIDRVISDAGVTKVTFYRHFPSKNDLIREFLEYRHQLWVAWFGEALRRNGNTLKALAPVLAEWFGDKHFRGCAFINSVGELGGQLPEVVEITRRHKQEVTTIIEKLLPPSRHRKLDAQAVTLAMDGAIIRAQFEANPDDALKVLNRILILLLDSSKR